MKNIILNSSLRDDYLTLVELYTKNSIYGCEEELLNYVDTLQKKMMEITPEERELMQLFFTTGAGWLSTKFPEESIVLLQCESIEDCKRIALILTDDENVMNQDIAYLTGVEVIDKDNYDDTMEKVSKVYEDMLNNGEAVKEEINGTDKVQDETPEVETSETQTETKSNTKWYLLGIAVTAAVIGGAVYVYNKFQEKDIVIISSDDL